MLFQCPQRHQGITIFLGFAECLAIDKMRLNICPNQTQRADHERLDRIGYVVR